MFFDIGWPELMLVGVIALVVIGPKDLPRALRVAGYWVRRARSLSREFQSSVDQMIREAELDDVREDLRKATEFDLDHEFHQSVDPDGTLGDSIRSPELPDYSAEGAAALPPPDAVAPEAPLASDMPEPDFVGFEAAEAPPEPAAPVGEQLAAPVGEPMAAQAKP